jgi:two-component system CheB/CheR fusion protein
MTRTGRVECGDSAVKKKQAPPRSFVKSETPDPIVQEQEVPEPCSFPTVGIGASAGGLETFTQLLKDLPTDTGMAFVLIQHLDPTHSSLLTSVLTKVTQMPVHEIVDGMKICPNEVFVIPPGADIGILGGKFAIFAREKGSRKPNMAIDFFFRALAAECGNRAIGVVLSGTATDGTEGLRAIKAENGVSLAQDPKSAKFDGMPQSAVNAEVVDFCLPIPELAQELVRLAHHPYVSGRITEVLSKPTDEQDLQKVFVLLRTAAGIDFSEYKSPTIKRRLARRMALLKIDSLPEYIKLLQSTPQEIKSLAADALIHVTSFFRDPEVFKKLQSSTFPSMLKGKALGTPIRIWVTGCSSGEEVYSIAISLLEYLGERSAHFPIQMFGSDLSEHMIEKARTGFYTESALRDVDAERLRRFFVKVEGGYKINSLVRDLCVFVRHDLARDPPFSKLDLVTCRNVLIYFEQPLQKRIISTFHYCLNQPGFLLLGRTESILSHDQFFTPLDKKNKIFAREAVTSQLRFSTLQNTPSKREPLRGAVLAGGRPAIDLSKQIDTLLLSEFAPAGVVINEKLEVLQYRGRTSLYLEQASGQPQQNLLKMVREGLFTTLKVAIGQAKAKLERVRKEDLQFKFDGKTRHCHIIVTPVAGGAHAKEPLFLVLFQEIPAPPKPKKGAPKGPKTKASKRSEQKEAKRAAALERELRANQEYLHALNEEHQKTNDTLNSVNEEFVSGNEELQSMNEELETAKEELQSTNEELTTVNDELQNRSLETAQVNDDLINLLNGVEIPILILDINRRLRRFTPKARSIMNLLPTDLGRQIDDIKPNIIVENLDQLVQDVIETVTTKEIEVQDRNSHWHRLQIRPYKTSDHKIAGAVLSLINIDALRRAVINAEWVRDYSASIVEAVQNPLLVLNEQFEVISANQAYYETFQTSKAETEGQSLYDIPVGKCSTDLLKTHLSKMLAKKSSFRNLEIDCEMPYSGRQVMAVSARPIQSHDGVAMILLSIEDITERKNRERDRRELLRIAEDAKVEAEKAKAEAEKATNNAEKANLAKDLFLATLSHELRTPLTSMILQAQMLQRGLDEARTKKASIAIERAARTQGQLIEDLLDVSRIVTGKLNMELAPVSLEEVIQSAVDTVSAVAESKSVVIETRIDPSVGPVSGDRVRLQQVIWNLLTNAIKFSAKSGQDKIVVTLKSVDGKAQIEVIDAGIGIAPEFLPQVFKRFSQAETTNTRTHGGLGLGLAIVRHLVDMHGGEVKVESPGKDQGAIFTVTLPLLDEKTQTSDTAKDTEKLDPVIPHARVLKKGRAVNLNGIRILLVEDDRDVRDALTDMLTQSGAIVRSAACANDAMQVLKEFTPDELVLDIAMPGEDGYSLLKRIRKLRPKGEKLIPALALTALASEKDREAAFSAGFQKHLVKPVDMDRLTCALLELNEQTHSVH